jgi:hypothetical protein
LFNIPGLLEKIFFCSCRKDFGSKLYLFPCKNYSFWGLLFFSVFWFVKRHSFKPRALQVLINRCFHNGPVMCPRSAIMTQWVCIGQIIICFILNYRSFIGYLNIYLKCCTILLLYTNIMFKTIVLVISGCHENIYLLNH